MGPDICPMEIWWLSLYWDWRNRTFSYIWPIHLRTTTTDHLNGLTGSTAGHISIAPRFKSRSGYVRRVFQLSIRSITFVGHWAHLACHVHKSGHKTATFKDNINVLTSSICLVCSVNWISSLVTRPCNLACSCSFSCCCRSRRSCITK